MQNSRKTALMINPKLELTIFVVVTITLALIISPIVNDYVFAVKKSSSIKTSGKTTSIQINGIKVLKVHTVPSKVTVGNTFGLRGIVINNSTATITFANGTCTSPLSITFNKNVISEPQTTTAPCKPQQVTLKPGEQTHILSPTNPDQNLRYGYLPDYHLYKISVRIAIDYWSSAATILSMGLLFQLYNLLVA